MKTIKILKSLIDPEIISHFEEEFDISDPKVEYEFDFNFICEGERCNIFIMFDVQNGEYHINYPTDIQLTDSKGLCYSVGNDEARQDENRLIISDKTYNPDQTTVQQEVTAHIKREQRKLNENSK